MNARTILLGACALMAISTAASAQDVVMRRPLPNALSPSDGQSVPTPSPSSTPRPGITPYDPNVTPVSGYGWSLDCSNLPPVCMQFDESYNLNQVPDAQCPASQSAAAENTATGYGLISLAAAGSRHGAQLCTGQDGTGNVSTNIGYNSCVSTNGAPGVTQFQCTHMIFNKGFAPGDYPIVQVNTTNNACETQAKDATWTMAAGTFGAIDPANVKTAISQQGLSCGSGNIEDMYGLSCGDNTCQDIGYIDSRTTSTPVLYTYAVDPSKCSTTQTVSDIGGGILAQLGLLQGAPGAAAQCSTPDVYGAKNNCVQKVTYDPGWPQNGQSHVTSASTPTCYAVYNAGDPAKLTLSQVDVSKCQTQHPTAAQTAILQTLSPDLQDYSKLDMTCGTAAVTPNYQRALGSASVDPTAPFTGAVRGNAYVTEKRTILASDTGTFYDLWQDEYYVPYVCTDAEGGSYYSPSNKGLYSEYPMDRATCPLNHAQDTQAMQSFVGNRSAAEQEFYLNDTDFTSGQCAGGGNCGITIDDQQDKQRYHITVRYARNYENGNAGCTGPDCSGL